MTSEAKSGGTKVVLIVVAIVVVLGILCCGGLYLGGKDWVDATFTMGQEMAAGAEALDASFAEAAGDDAVWALEQHGNDGMAMIVGVPEIPDDPAEIQALQDAAWGLYTDSFAGGGPPLTGVAVGKAVRRTKGDSHQGQAEGWQENFASAETLAERTGIPAAPVSEFFRKIYALQKKAEDHAYDEVEGPHENE